jgi:hypothetical protein
VTSFVAFAETVIGPSDPFAKLGEPEVLARNAAGVEICRQEFSDGFVYEARIPKGIPYNHADTLFEHIPCGIWMNAYNPVQDADFNDPSFYISIWVVKSGALN